MARSKCNNSFTYHTIVLLTQFCTIEGAESTADRVFMGCTVAQLAGIVCGLVLILGILHVFCLKNCCKNREQEEQRISETTPARSQNYTAGPRRPQRQRRTRRGKNREQEEQRISETTPARSQNYSAGTRRGKNREQEEQRISETTPARSQNYSAGTRRGKNREQEEQRISETTPARSQNYSAGTRRGKNREQEEQRISETTPARSQKYTARTRRVDKQKGKDNGMKPRPFARSKRYSIWFNKHSVRRVEGLEAFIKDVESVHPPVPAAPRGSLESSAGSEWLQYITGQSSPQAGNDDSGGGNDPGPPPSMPPPPCPIYRGLPGGESGGRRTRDNRRHNQYDIYNDDDYYACNA